MSPPSEPVALDIAALEDVAARAVPAAEIADIGGWRLRCTPGVGTRRPNSVLARAHDPDDDLSERIAAVERFYTQRGCPARFQMTSASRPVDLADRLSERGYVAESLTHVHVAALTAVAAGDDPPVSDAETTGRSAPDGTWLTTWVRAWGLDRSQIAAPAALWSRIPGEVAFTRVTVDGVAAGVGMGVVDGEWLGIFNMATVAPARRRGAARTALRELSRWGLAHGAQRAYLQVDGANRGAQALYAAVGFTHAYDYSYLVREGRG
jgi:GNAT superfamily N-acetyltransferase